MKKKNGKHSILIKILPFLVIAAAVVFLHQTVTVGVHSDAVSGEETEGVTVDSVTSLASGIGEQLEATPTPTPEPTPTPTPTPEPVDEGEQLRKSLDDISTHDMAGYLAEMPAEDSDIVSTATEVYTYEQMVKDIYFLSQRYPGLFVTNILGTTADGRALYEVILGNIASPHHVLIQYSIHSREYINTLLAMCQLEDYLKNMMAGTLYGEKSYPDLFSNICIHMMPCSNPDGMTISQMGPDGLRTQEAKDTLQACYEFDVANGRAGDFETYCRRFKANANGVDLNKNFDVGWDIYAGGPTQPSYEGYHGPAPASEAETQAILSVTESYPVIAVISYHSEGDVIFWNYELEDEQLLAFDQQLADSLAEITGYTRRISKKYNASLSGGCSDYYVWEEGRIAVTVETGQDTCPIRINVFPNIWRDNQYVLPMLATLYGVAG